MRRWIVAALVLVALASGAEEPDGDLARWVDPFIGTGGHGHTFPGPALPFGMVQVGPDTRLTGWDGTSGYHYDDTFVHGFSHTHLSGTGIADYCDVLLLPSSGPVEPGAGSRFRKESEAAQPGYYRVRLEGSGVDVELTATPRTGWHRYTFPAGADPYVLLDLRHRDEVLESRLEVVDERTVRGLRRSRSWARDQRIYFVAEFDRPFDATLVVGGEPRRGLRAAAGTDLAAVLRLPGAAGGRVVARVGISAVDLDGALANLRAEAPDWDFDRVRREARAAWNEALASILIEGGGDGERTVFYTALYHALLQPNLFEDVDGRHRGMDGAIHRDDGHVRYTVFSLWDTFRAAHPLYALIERRRTVDFVRTFLGQYRESGRLPVWELAGNETDTMIGYHAVAVIADAWAKGIRDFDAELALAAMVATADADRFGLDAYRRRGYIPADAEPESVSKTLEYAYDDWTIARFAAALGHDAESRRFRARSQAWRHLLAGDGFLRPRLEGRWLEPFDPFEVNFHYTEANAWQYAFFVPHDVSDFAARLGGPAVLEARLDALFTADSATTGRAQADITGLVGQYAHGNEPSHHLAYLYAFAGAPAKTQARVRRLMDEMYSPRPDGLAGNEDCGQMSAWYVLSALGFYPVTPGLPEYVIGTPRFDAATIRLENGRRFTIRARRSSPSAFYVRSARLDGVPYERSYLLHDDVLRGGELEFELGEEPTTWGAAEDDRPRTAPASEPVVAAPVAVGPRFAGAPVEIVLEAFEPVDAIHYTLDGSEPGERSPRYAAPLRLEPPAAVTFRARRGGRWSATVTAPVHRLDPRRRVTLGALPDPQYTGGGEQALVDGLRGGPDFRLGRWQGFHGVELEAVVDLGEPRARRRVATGFLNEPGSWIFLPLAVRYEVSDDGAAWRPLGVIELDDDWGAGRAERREIALDLETAVVARYLRVVTRSRLVCPEGHPGAGEPAWLFVDEIAIE